MIPYDHPLQRRRRGAEARGLAAMRRLEFATRAYWKAFAADAPAVKESRTATVAEVACRERAKELVDADAALRAAARKARR